MHQSVLQPNDTQCPTVTQLRPPARPGGRMNGLTALRTTSQSPPNDLTALRLTDERPARCAAPDLRDRNHRSCDLADTRH